ncbi:tail length tape measure protein [Vibrio phage D292]
MSDFLNMSDEDFLNAGEPHREEILEESGSDEEQLPPEEGEVTPEPEADTLDDEAEESDDEDELDDTDTTEGTDDVDSEDQEEEEPEESDEEEEDPSSSTGSDLDRILQPFKANGKEIQVKNVDEAITLMQMGANFTKKMQSLQPNLKMLKTLEKNDLLDEGKLNYLIDLSRKDPKAIAKLVQESGFDALEVDEDVEYTPTDHQVSSQSLQLEQVLESIESTPTYAKCIDLVGNQWDEDSKQKLTQEPRFIAELNEQMSLGIFDKINAEVERTKMFGGLSGLSDFEAYRAVGAQMYKDGQLNVEPAKPVATTEIKPKDAARSKKRKAAATPKPARKVTKQAEINPLAMSDEDFLKINNLNV